MKHYYFNLIMLFFAAGMFAIMIARESTLIQKIKQWLSLTDPYNPKLNIFTRIASYWKMLPKGLFFIFLPLIIPLVILLSLHKLLAELLNCPYCISFWILLSFLYIDNIDIKTSILYAFTAPIAVHLIYKLY